MLAVFSSIFVADTKIIFRYDFVAPLTTNQLNCVHHDCIILEEEVIFENKPHNVFWC